MQLVEKAVKGISMHIDIVYAGGRPWTLHREYCRALRIAGYRGVPATKPHLAIQYITKKLKPHQMYRRMMDIMEWRKNDKFPKETFCRFTQEVAKQAEKLHVEQRGNLAHPEKTAKAHARNRT